MIQQPTENTERILIEKIKELPQHRLIEVIDFVDFLRSRSQDHDDPILDVIGCLSGEPLSSQELENELYGRDPA
jgi:hypothetical protein